MLSIITNAYNWNVGESYVLPVQNSEAYIDVVVSYAGYEIQDDKAVGFGIKLSCILMKPNVSKDVSDEFIVAHPIRIKTRDEFEQEGDLIPIGHVRAYPANWNQEGRMDHLYGMVLSSRNIRDLLEQGAFKTNDGWYISDRWLTTEPMPGVDAPSHIGTEIVTIFNEDGFYQFMLDTQRELSVI